jgi:uncharacterized protein involved in exopolysaccharide biosynthesis/Mrp family chromosome partitioning ATPase
MPGVQTTANDIDVDLGRLFGSLLANWRRVVIVSLVVTGLAFAFALLATPHYRGETRLLIETRESVFTRPDLNGETDRPILDEEGVTSQVEVIGSTDILKQVAKKLDLAALPEFDEAADISSFARLLVTAGLKSDPNEIPPEERVLKAMREKLGVYRIEKSRVIVIEFSSEDPRLAAEIPNVIADTYLAVQREAKLQSNSDATDWLAPEIEDLRKRVKEAEAKVADYRAKSDLLIGQNNSVLATQQLSELSASLDAIPEVLSSGLIQRLRESRVQLKAEISDLSATLLGSHPRIRALNSQLGGLDSQIRSEAEKVLRGLETEAKTAQLREEQLVADLNRLKAESARAGEEEVELRALEREAAAQRELLESYLTRYREAASRKERNYLPVDARIFSRANAPSEPYFPKTIPIVGAAFVASLLVMAIVTLLRELFSGQAMRPASGVAMQPIAEIEMRALPAPAEADRPGEDELRPMARAESTVPPQAASTTGGRSRFGEITIESAAEKLIASGAARAIFVSPEGDEAAATTIFVAREMADAGLRVLLLDLTASGAASRPMLETTVYSGITNLLASEARFSDVIHADLYSDCHVIPLGTADIEKAMRGIDRLSIIMNSLTTAYDIVVVECGPAEAEDIRRLVTDGTEIMVSVLEPGDKVVGAAAEELRAEGFGNFTLVSPSGHKPPVAPLPGRSVA